MTDVSETRRRAWETRRQKYGPSGHAGVYDRGPCTRCRGMREFIARLSAEGTITEGQAAKATGLDRVSIRKLADEWRNRADAVSALGRREG